MDRRWQLVLDCVDTDEAPFSKGTLVAFRRRLIEGQMDRRLIERTITLARQSQEFGPRALRAALDSSPLWGAGRVEDTYNLVGHALKKALRVVADQQGREMIEVAQEAGAELVSGSSLKAALDRDWDQHLEKDEALVLVLNVLRAVETWVQTLPQEEVLLAQPSLAIAHQVKGQDVHVDEEGKEHLIKGVAKDRLISVEDGQMRHGRKSRSVLVDGYKRHVLHDLDTGFIRAVGLTPANVPEASVTGSISEDLDQQDVCLKELHIDRAYLSSHLVRERSDDLEVYCKAWPVRESKCFSKQTFTLDWERQIIQCPALQEMPFVPGEIVHFPKETCSQCPLKEQCTTSAKGRSVSIHPDEALPLSYASANSAYKDVLNYANAWLSSTLWLMWVGGKGGALAIADCARISSICVAVPSFTICTFSLVPRGFWENIRTPLDPLTDILLLRKSGEMTASTKKCLVLDTMTDFKG